MKKCIFLLLIGAALLSCRENPKREELIREYYENSIACDSLYFISDSIHNLMNAVGDSLKAAHIIPLDDYRYCCLSDDWLFIMKQYESRAESEMFYYNLQKSYRTLFDRNYFRIYKKELIKQGRLKE